MSLNFSAAHSSRVRKRPQQRYSPLRRPSSSKTSPNSQPNTVHPSKSRQELSTNEGIFFEERLEDSGVPTSLTGPLTLSDVPQAIQHVKLHMFNDIPERGGFNSTRIAELYNIRKSFPPTVTISHVHALMSAPSKTEREISELVKACKVRKITIPGRGIGMSSAGEGLVLYHDLERLLAESVQINEALGIKFYDYLRFQPLRQKIPRAAFTNSEITVLLNTGFLTSAQSPLDSANTFTSSVKSGTPTSIASVSKAASGSIEAIGGEGAVHRAGGGIRGINVHGNQPGSEELDRGIQLGVSEFQLALPNMGPYLRLLFAARSHLISLIKKSSFQEAPLYLLRERWDGGISADDPAAKAKKYRGEFVGVLPSKTKKWRQFYGLSFEWVLAECLGAGLLELFETRSVGQAARIT